MQINKTKFTIFSKKIQQLNNFVTFYAYTNKKMTNKQKYEARNKLEANPECKMKCI